MSTNKMLWAKAAQASAMSQIPYHIFIKGAESGVLPVERRVLGRDNTAMLYSVPDVMRIRDMTQAERFSLIERIIASDPVKQRYSGLIDGELSDLKVDICALTARVSETGVLTCAEW